LPLPVRPVPRQTAFALRIMEVSFASLSPWFLSSIWLGSLSKI
jgi:hypothetical protein